MSRALYVLAALLLLAWPRAAAAKGCHEVSYVVGYAHCSRFGGWSRDQDLPRLVFDLGYFRHTFASPGFAFAPPPPAPEAVSTSTAPDSASRPARAQGIAMRMIGGIGPALYVGGEILAGALTLTPNTDDPDPTTSIYFGGHAIAGVHGSVSRLGFGAELAAGGRIAMYDLCGTSNCKTSLVQSVTQTRREVEARLRADVYIHPHVSIGAMYGVSLVDRGDRQLVLSLGLHMRAIDGT